MAVSRWVWIGGAAAGALAIFGIGALLGSRAQAAPSPAIPPSPAPAPAPAPPPPAPPAPPPPAAQGVTTSITLQPAATWPHNSVTAITVKKGTTLTVALPAGATWTAPLAWTPAGNFNAGSAPSGGSNPAAGIYMGGGATLEAEWNDATTATSQRTEIQIRDA